MLAKTTDLGGQNDYSVGAMIQYVAFFFGVVLFLWLISHLLFFLLNLVWRKVARLGTGHIHEI